MECALKSYTQFLNSISLGIHPGNINTKKLYITIIRHPKNATISISMESFLSNIQAELRTIILHIKEKYPAYTNLLILPVIEKYDSSTLYYIIGSLNKLLNEMEHCPFTITVLLTNLCKLCNQEAKFTAGTTPYSCSKCGKQYNSQFRFICSGNHSICNKCSNIPMSLCGCNRTLIKYYGYSDYCAKCNEMVNNLLKCPICQYYIYYNCNNKYTQLGMIGKGEYGTVYKCTNNEGNVEYYADLRNERADFSKCK